MWSREYRVIINIDTAKQSDRTIPSNARPPQLSCHSALIQSCRRSRCGASCIGKCGTTGRALGSTRRKFGLCNRSTTTGDRGRRLDDTQRSDAFRRVECACWVVSSSRDSIRSTILRCTCRRRIGRKNDNRTARVGSSVGISGRLAHGRIFLLGNGFGRARGAGTRTRCASLGATVGCWDGCCGCYGTGRLEAVQSKTAAGCSVGN